jgi:receptor protein-tyrosine kinase
MSPEDRAHLVERAAALLREDAGLAGPDLDLPPAQSESLATRPEQAASRAATSQAAPVTMVQLQRAGVVLLGGSRTRTTEEFRICVGRLVRALRELRAGAANLVMVTSPRPGEGKSFSTLNMAASIARNGVAEALLIDCDAKPGSISTILEQRQMPGLFDLTADPTLSMADTILRTEIPGLSLLPVGRLAEGTDSGATRPVLTTIERIARSHPHHVVLLDTPPCLSTSDPSTFSQIVDVSVLIVQAERTQRSEIEASIELLQHCPNIMLMLNQLRMHSQASFGNYYYYGYPS